MKLLFILILSAGSIFADWSDVSRLQAGAKLEVRTTDGVKLRADFVSATQDSLVLQGKTVPKSQIKEIKIHDPGRRLRRGLIWMGVGAAAGAGAGAVGCLSCANEGHNNPYIGAGVAAGAALGALGFLTSPWKTIYK